MGSYATREASRAAYNRWYQAHPTANAERNKRDRVRVKQELFVLLGNVCSKCGYADHRALQVDHIHANPVRTKWHRGGVGLYRAILRGDYPLSDFQLLCANCNWIKRVENEEHGGNEFKYVN